MKKKLIAIGIAGALAAASVGATTKSAQASAGGAILTGVLVGVGVVLLFHHIYPRTTFGLATYSYTPIGYDGHVAWCKANYKTYKVVTDSYTGKGGAQYKCVSPNY